MLRGLRMARIRPSRLRILNAGSKIQIGFTNKSYFQKQMFANFMKLLFFGKPNSNFKPRDQNPKSRRTDPRHPEAPEQR